MTGLINPDASNGLGGSKKDLTFASQALVVVGSSACCYAAWEAKSVSPRRYARAARRGTKTRHMHAVARIPSSPSYSVSNRALKRGSFCLVEPAQTRPIVDDSLTTDGVLVLPAGADLRLGRDPRIPLCYGKDGASAAAIGLDRDSAAGNSTISDHTTNGLVKSDFSCKSGGMSRLRQRLQQG